MIIAVGLALTALSLWQMTHFSLQMDTWPIITSGILQGFGVGLCWVPLSAVAFTTLPANLRNEGTAFFNLLRNVGSSIGISVVMFLLTQNTQNLHAAIAEHITPYNWAIVPPRRIISTPPPSGPGRTGWQISNQAAMIAYIDDFQLMMVLTIAVIPLVVVLRNPPRQAGEHAAIME